MFINKIKDYLSRRRSNRAAKLAANIGHSLAKEFSSDYILAISVHGYLFLLAKEDYQVLLGITVAGGEVYVMVNILTTSMDGRPLEYVQNNYPKVYIEEERFRLDKETGHVLIGDEAYPEQGKEFLN